MREKGARERGDAPQAMSKTRNFLEVMWGWRMRHHLVIQRKRHDLTPGKWGLR